MKNRFRWALGVSGTWALLPLGYYLPDGASDALSPAIQGLCFPAWIVSYLLLGGVHSGMFSLFPIVCALLTWMMAFGVFVLVTRDPVRARRVSERKTTDEG